MTSGRFLRVQRSLDGDLFVVRADDAQLGTEALSTGTREQLYLAIRLAYIEHYSQSAEALPIVLDDVLVNFDDARATATIAALASFAERSQVVLFTCHKHVVALAEAAAMDIALIELQS